MVRKGTQLVLAMLIMALWGCGLKITGGGTDTGPEEKVALLEEPDIERCVANRYQESFSSNAPTRTKICWSSGCVYTVVR